MLVNGKCDMVGGVTLPVNKKDLRAAKREWEAEPEEGVSFDFLTRVVCA